MKSHCMPYILYIDKGRFRTPFLTLKNHFENRPSTILNFLEHMQLSHKGSSTPPCDSGIRMKTNEHWWFPKINPKHALMARQPFTTRTNRRSSCVCCWTLFISLPCTQNPYKSSLVLKSSQIVNAPSRYVKKLLFDDSFEGLRRGFLCSWHRLCLLKISPLS